MDVRFGSIKLGRRAAQREPSVHLQFSQALFHADEYDRSPNDLRSSESPQIAPARGSKYGQCHQQYFHRVEIFSTLDERLHARIYENTAAPAVQAHSARHCGAGDRQQNHHGLAIIFPYGDFVYALEEFYSCSQTQSFCIFPLEMDGLS